MVIVFTCSHVFSITQHLARSLSTLRRSAHFIAQSLAFALCTLRLRSATMRNNKKTHEHTIKNKKRSKNP